MPKQPISNSTKKSIIELKGIWMPEKINWQDGDFDTYYFPNDSSVIIISSTQKRINDSILFNTEEGFNLMKGSLSFSSDSSIETKPKTLYRFIKLVDSAGREVFLDTSVILIKPIQAQNELWINKTLYIRASQYTEQSKQDVINIATKMVSEIEKHPEKYK